MELWAHTCCQWRRLGEGALGLLASHSLGVLGTWAGSNEEREHHISEQKLVSGWTKLLLGDLPQGSLSAEVCNEEARAEK
jgi:hypothetical protein